MGSLYFDPSRLKDYLSLGLKLKIYVDGQYLTLSDLDDLKKGEGVGDNGEMYPFKYQDIDHVKIGAYTFTKAILDPEFKKKEQPPSDGENDTNQGDAKEFPKK